MVGSIALRWTVYKTHIISTIVDKSLCTMLEPVYKTHIISTIVDTHIISTIVDSYNNRLLAMSIRLI